MWLKEGFYVLSVRNPGCLWGQGELEDYGSLQVLLACLVCLYVSHGLRPIFAQHTLWLKENKMIESKDVSSGNHAHLHQISWKFV